MNSENSIKAKGQKSTSNLCTYALITCVLMLASCANEQQYESVEQICTPQMDKARIMQIAEEVLRQMHFTIAKADAETGFIRTRPLPGAKFFEFWRSDNIGTFNAAEANLHSIRRIAELNISRPPRLLGENKNGGQLCIDCDVNVQRLSLPQRQISSAWSRQEMFTQSDSSIQTLRLHPEQKTAMAWVDLGQDAKLATEILKRIEKRLTAENAEIAEKK